MAVDTPASIAIVGAGPVGLEAALYARYLGYDVLVYDRSLAVVSAMRNSDAALSWRASISPLGIAAIAAQNPGWQPPDPAAVLPARAVADAYFTPLARTDLLADCLKLGHEVLAIERDIEPGEEPAAEDELTGFRLRVRSAEGEKIDKVDIVFDASGRRQTGEDPLSFGELRIAQVASHQEFASTAPQRLITAEPDFYILGAKSAPAGHDFQLVEGLAQIRDLFTIIADRANLDLYAMVHGA